MFKKSNLFLIRELLPLFLAGILISGCGPAATGDSDMGTEKQTWAEKLGFPSDKKVIIFHADDMGMVGEANEATFHLLENGHIQSAAAMAPCPAFKEAINWAIDNPRTDVGIHLTLTSEWRDYRWGPVADPAEVPGLTDPDGYMWRSVKEVVMNATPEEVEKELRAQIEKTLTIGYRPDHMDTHMGTLYGSNDFTEVYLRLAEEYRIPAMVIDFSDPVVAEQYKQAGYPVSDRLFTMLENYSLPKLDYFSSIPHGDSYEDMRENFFDQIRSLKPGLTEIIFHPQFESELVKTITGSWQQRAWEAELFADPVVKEFFEEEELIFTNWIEIMERFERIKGS
ncbi:MAG: polysaccharide deacetylase family protein [Bacteroidales bacterium]